jgi:hypothetical protein
MGGLTMRIPRGLSLEAVARAAGLAVLVAFIGCRTGPAVEARDASAEAVGADEALVQLTFAHWTLELPRTLLRSVELRFGEGDERTQLELGPAPLGATAESLAAREGETLRALYGALPTQARVQFGNTRAIESRVAERTVWVAMRNPWRSMRLFFPTSEREALRAPPHRCDVLGLRFSPGLPLLRGSFSASDHGLRFDGRTGRLVAGPGDPARAAHALAQSTATPR